ncbi:hypothetical protein VT06_13885 [Arsukibacterium sp. MJ3]|uniref:RNA-directed DNA polymerase n=1 Tax=Arsukibacterium sp. MJ3 TaxID=1632859 RepID=UPI0006272142|nr:RNA-directed DNA polymerase [Arsukibacterium sp. MJ3]KKO47980.1 hypothetical protein VT06_13885 [Arsukibacterium sp. MJ3]
MELKGLLERGYFPKELPKPFTTESYARALDAAYEKNEIIGIEMPGHFGKPIVKESKIPVAKEVFYSLARGGLLRRQLSICNPVLFFLLAREIVKNWQEIKLVVSGSKFAATAPEYKTEGRAINGRYPQNGRIPLAIRDRIGARYLLKTDISRFYHSIYTHSIPWALHGKKVAKANRKLDSLGNKLDYLVRQGQDGQTVGIPIGPDTSLVIAEMLMHRVDKALANASPEAKGHRFIDDYEISFVNRDEAERAYHLLDAELAEFELALNIKKTKIEKLPLRLEEEWATYFKSFEFRHSVKFQSSDLETYFSKAFEYHRIHNDEPVMQWAIACLSSLRLREENWELLQRLLLLSVAPEPACLPFVLTQIIQKRESKSILVNELTTLLNTIILEHASLKHSSEVANALWGCLALELRLFSDTCDKVSSCRDSCVALLALDCQQNNLTDKKLNKTVWEEYLNKEELYGDQWLLAYESNIKGWLQAKNKHDYVSADPSFSFLKRRNVSFYRAKADWDDMELPTTPSFTPYDGNAY